MRVHHGVGVVSCKALRSCTTGRPSTGASDTHASRLQRSTARDGTFRPAGTRSVMQHVPAAMTMTYRSGNGVHGRVAGEELTAALERQVAAASRKYSHLSLHAVAGVLIAALSIGLLESFKALVATRSRGIAIPLPWLLLNNMPWWFLWAALTPLVIVAAS